MIKLTELTDKLPYPPEYRAKMMEIHSIIFEHACNHFDSSIVNKQYYTNIFNLTSYLILQSEELPNDLFSEDTQATYMNLEDEIKSRLGSLFFTYKQITWDIDVADNAQLPQFENTSLSECVNMSESSIEDNLTIDTFNPSIEDTSYLLELHESTIEDLSFDPVLISQLDVSTKYTYSPNTIIYKHRKTIPETQRQININTDVDLFTTSELLRLFPDRYIDCRVETSSSEFYTKSHKLFGKIPTISGFSQNQIIQNIVEYPYLPAAFFRRVGRNTNTGIEQIVGFTGFIENSIGEVKSIKNCKELFKDISDCNDSDVISEYILRRYLLERDIQSINHRSKMYEEIGPFHTLNMPASEYTNLGYDPVEVARKCVTSRVNMIKKTTPVYNSVSNISDCIYGANCMRSKCDLACSVHAELSYWMNRCEISMDNPVLNLSDSDINLYTPIIESNQNRVCAYKTRDTVYTADAFAYICICLHGRGTALTKGIYKLDFSSYLDLSRDQMKSFSIDETLEYIKIFCKEEKYLIISNLDYVRFGDYESQLLLQLIQQRRKVGYSTYVILPNHPLNGKTDSTFFNLLDEKLKEVSVK